MPLASQLVGQSSEPLVQEIDARWTMAYAAGLGDTLPCYMDTRGPQGVVAHPLFPVCFEWPLVVAGRSDDRLTPMERMRAVHATHDLIIHRLVRSGDRLTTRLSIAGIECRTPGAYEVLRLDTTDAAGAPVCTTWMGVLYRGVEVEGPDRPAVDWPPLPRGNVSAASHAEVRVPIAATAAHVYTECARIWNPIHTDAAFADAAGLPGIILHGTATLALAVSRVITAEAGNAPQRVSRITGRFDAMVRVPSEIIVRIRSREPTADGDVVAFEVRNAAGEADGAAEGELAVRDGFVVLRAS